jgi:hypothetical protein
MSDRPVLHPPPTTAEIIFEEIERIRWHTSSGLSVFQNLDLLTGYECAEIHLRAIEKALRAIDCARETPESALRFLAECAVQAKR